MPGPAPRARVGAGGGGEARGTASLVGSQGVPRGLIMNAFIGILEPQQPQFELPTPIPPLLGLHSLRSHYQEDPDRVLILPFLSSPVCIPGAGRPLTSLHPGLPYLLLPELARSTPNFIPLPFILTPLPRDGGPSLMLHHSKPESSSKVLVARALPYSAERDRGTKALGHSPSLPSVPPISPLACSLTSAHPLPLDQVPAERGDPHPGWEAHPIPTSGHLPGQRPAGRDASLGRQPQGHPTSDCQRGPVLWGMVLCVVGGGSVVGGLRPESDLRQSTSTQGTTSHIPSHRTMSSSWRLWNRTRCRSS